MVIFAANNKRSERSLHDVGIGMTNPFHPHQEKTLTPYRARQSVDHNVLQLKGVTDLNGNLCKVQPKQNEIPVLNQDGPQAGCTYRSLHRFKIGKSGTEHLPHLNPIELYRQAEQQSVRIEGTAVIKGKEWPFQGTGVIIAKDKNVYIATDNHVIHPELVNRKLTNPDYVKYTAFMPDGNHYLAKTELSKPRQDMAVISIEAPPEIAKSYGAATFAKSPTARGHGIIFGFPGFSRSLYASMADFNGTPRAGHVFGKDLLAGEDSNRRLHRMKAHTADGQSGGLYVDDIKGRAHGLFEGWKHVGHVRTVYGNPLSRRQINDWLSEIRSGSAS